jgi:hypothetical protein
LPLDSVLAQQERLRRGHGPRGFVR